MKKTIAFAIFMIAVFCAAFYIFSSKMENQWQQPQSDSLNLSVSSPVDMVEREYKVYKYEKAAEDEYNVDNIETTEHILDFEKAGYIACEYLDNLLPEQNIGEKIFEGRLRKTPAFTRYTDAYRFLHKYQTNDGENMALICDIDAYTGQCLQVMGSYENGAKDYYNPQIKHQPFTQKQNQQALEYSLNACDSLGFSDCKSYAITKSYGYNPERCYVYIYTENDTLLKIYLSLGEQIQLIEFCNETACGYKTYVKDIAKEIPQ